MTSKHERGSLGVVVIGRNEGERLERCLRSALEQCPSIVYVDSGSTDGSAAMARRLGVEVVDLDMVVPFTAARARNAGWERARSLHSGLRFVQFVDGDCELVPGWLSTAREVLLRRPEVAVACGRRRERFRDASVYNRLCDLEWDTPVGEVGACGGDALMRLEALESVGGFDPGLIAGEEPDLCLRLRRKGYVILRIDAEMTRHDAAMTHFGQWWRRMVRSGYAAADALGRHGRAAARDDARRVRSAFVWGIALPCAVLAAIGIASGRGPAGIAPAALLCAILLFGAQVARIARKETARREGAADAWVYAAFCMLAKAPESIGMAKVLVDRLGGKRPRLIEYK